MSYADDQRSSWYQISLIPAPPRPLSRYERLIGRPGASPYRRWQTWIALLNWPVSMCVAHHFIYHAGLDSPLRWFIALYILLIGYVPYQVIVATAQVAALWKEVLERDENR